MIEENNLERKKISNEEKHEIVLKPENQTYNTNLESSNESNMKECEETQKWKVTNNDKELIKYDEDSKMYVIKGAVIYLIGYYIFLLLQNHSFAPKLVFSVFWHFYNNSMCSTLLIFISRPMYLDIMYEKVSGNMNRPNPKISLGDFVILLFATVAQVVLLNKTLWNFCLYLFEVEDLFVEHVPSFLSYSWDYMMFPLVALLGIYFLSSSLICRMRLINKIWMNEPELAEKVKKD